MSNNFKDCMLHWSKITFTCFIIYLKKQQTGDSIKKKSIKHASDSIKDKSRQNLRIFHP